MAVDLLRSSHRTHAELGEYIGAPGGRVWIRWYPCREGAKALPIEHAFLSPVWEYPPDEWQVGPGVESDRQWRSSRYAEAGPGDHYHGPAEWWARGIPDAYLAARLPPPPPDPACEVQMGIQVWDVDGATILDKYEDVEILRVDRARRAGVEVADGDSDLTVFGLGITVGAVGGPSIDRVNTVLFSGATVDQVDPTTVKVTVAAGGAEPYRLRLLTGEVENGLAYLAEDGIDAQGSSLQFVVLDTQHGGLLGGIFGGIYSTVDHLNLAGGGVDRTYAGGTTHVGGMLFVNGLYISGSVTSGTIILGTTPVTGGSEGELMRIGPGGTVAQTDTVGGFQYV